MSEEIDELDKKYLEESEFLLKRIEDREELRGLLKIAVPAKISELRAAIARLDKIINKTEKLMEMVVEQREMQLDLEKQYEELDEMNKIIEPELLAYLEKNNPEAYEKLKAELEEIDAKYPDEDE